MIFQESRDGSAMRMRCEKMRNFFVTVVRCDAMRILILFSHRIRISHFFAFSHFFLHILQISSHFSQLFWYINCEISTRKVEKVRKCEKSAMQMRNAKKVRCKCEMRKKCDAVRWTLTKSANAMRKGFRTAIPAGKVASKSTLSVQSILYIKRGHVWLCPHCCTWCNSCISSYKVCDNLMALRFFSFQMWPCSLITGPIDPSRQDTCIGVDLNRNWGHQWGGMGADTNPCGETYRGPAAFSEPETKAVKEAFDVVAARTVLYISYHSYGEMILLPWGYTYMVPKNFNKMKDNARVYAGRTKPRYKYGSGSKKQLNLTWFSWSSGLRSWDYLPVVYFASRPFANSLIFFWCSRISAVGKLGCVHWVQRGKYGQPVCPVSSSTAGYAGCHLPVNPP